MALPFPLRFDQQEEFVPRANMLKESAAVIGVGAVGRQVALHLVALGVPKLQLIDPATVQLDDVTVAGFLSEDIDCPKVDAVGGLCHRTEPLLDLETVGERYRPSHQVGTYVFCCLNGRADRAAIWETLHKRCRFWGDARIDAESARILVAADEAAHRRYRRILAEGDDEELPLKSARSAYVGALAAALVVHQFVRYLRNQPIVAEASFDFATGKYIVAD
jgi:hypothetical protein